MDPDQTAPIGAVWSGSTLFVKEACENFSRRQDQTTFVLIGALRVYILVRFNVPKYGGFLGVLVLQYMI